MRLPVHRLLKIVNRLLQVLLSDFLHVMSRLQLPLRFMDFLQSSLDGRVGPVLVIFPFVIHPKILPCP